MRDDFAFFIVSNGRPNNQATLDQILNSGYSGDWFIVCDDLDVKLDEYKERYGDKILVFNKVEWAEKTDTYESSHDLRSVVYARNASIQLARDLGYKYMAQFDDDQKRFTLRVEEGDKLRSQVVEENMDAVLSAYVQLLEDTPIEVLAMGNGMNYIGGLNGAFQKRMGTWLYSTFFIKLDSEIEFRGLHNEDYILTSHYAKRGHLLYNIYDVQTNDFQRGTNEGGLFDIYQATSSYQLAFYAILESPDSTLIRTDSLGQSHISQYQKYRIPRLLNEKWRLPNA